MIGIPEIMKFGDAVLIMSLCMLSVVTNLRVCYLVTVTFSGRNLSASNALVAHLSYVSIWNAFLAILHVIEQSRICDVSYFGSCQVLYFVLGTSNTVFLINTAGVLYETVRSVCPSLRELTLPRMLCLMWTLAGMGNAPLIFIVEYDYISVNHHVGTCKKTNIQGELYVSLIYVVWKIIVYHVALTLYLAYAMLQILSALPTHSILKSIPDRVKRRKVQKMRFAISLFISFILVSLPTGFLSGTLEVLERNVDNMPLVDIFKRVLILLNFTSHIVNPLMFVLMNKNMSAREFCFVLKQVNVAQVVEDTNHSEKYKNQNGSNSFDIRRLKQSDRRRQKARIKMSLKADPMVTNKSGHVSPHVLYGFQLPDISTMATESSTEGSGRSIVYWHRVFGDVVENKDVAQVKCEKETLI